MHTDLRAQFSPSGQRERINRLVRLSGSRLLSGLDRFYLQQRVRHFMGNGLALYRANVDCRTPFLDRDWCSAIAALPRHWKIGANWHRYAIWRNWPQLLDFPEERVGNRMARRAPASYWLPLGRRPDVVPYARYGEWFGSPLIVNAVREHSRGLADLVDLRVVERILHEHEQSSNRVRAVGVLLSLGIWRELVGLASGAESGS